jgi:hypothetical protein
VCGASEGGLTTDCPGSKVDIDKQKEIYETALDYTDTRGWHLGEPMKARSPRFAEIEPAPALRDWRRIDRTMALKDNLTQKAIAWALADRIAEDHSASYGRLADTVKEHMRGKQEPDERGRELFAELEHEKIGFHLADQLAVRCDEELRQAARLLVGELEGGETVSPGVKIPR